MPLHRLREEEASFDVGAQLLDDGREVEVVGLLLEDHERRDDVESRLDHRRELAGEDLQRLRLDLLEDVLGALFPGRRELVQAVRQQAADAELLAGPREIRRVELSGELEAGGVDRGIRESSHRCPSGELSAGGLRA